MPLLTQIVIIKTQNHDIPIQNIFQQSKYKSEENLISM